MSRKYNTRHSRGRSHYGPKARARDQYGTFRQGERLSNDKLNIRKDDNEDEQQS